MSEEAVSSEKERNTVYQAVTEDDDAFWINREDARLQIEKTDNCLSAMRQVIIDNLNPKDDAELEEVNKKWSALHEAMRQVSSSLDASIWYIERYGEDKARALQALQIKKDKNPKVILNALRNLKRKPKEHICDVCRCSVDKSEHIEKCSDTGYMGDTIGKD